MEGIVCWMGAGCCRVTPKRLEKPFGRNRPILIKTKVKLLIREIDGENRRMKRRAIRLDCSVWRQGCFLSLSLCRVHSHHSAVFFCHSLQHTASSQLQAGEAHSSIIRAGQRVCVCASVFPTVSINMSVMLCVHPLFVCVCVFSSSSHCRGVHYPFS